MKVEDSRQTGSQSAAVTPEATDPEALLAQALQGDESALIALLAHFAPAIRRSISIAPKWRSTLEADDVLQVTFTEAFLRIDQFVGGHSRAFLTWIQTIARNNVRAAIRGLQSSKRPQPEHRRVAAGPSDLYHDDLLRDLAGTTSATPSRAFARNEIGIVVEQALEQMPPEYAAALRFYYFEGLVGEALAARMSRSRGAALMLLARARDRIGEIIGTPSHFFTDSP